jgi:uncharacterized protein
VARPRVVFDTNIFVRALINPKGINARLILSLSRYILVTSAAILEEVAEVLIRPGVLDVAAVRKLDVERILELLGRAPMVSPSIAVTVCRDPDDNKFLEAAIAAGAEYLVTSDKGLRDLDEYEYEPKSSHSFESLLLLNKIFRPRIAALNAGPGGPRARDQPITGTVVRQLLGRRLPEVTDRLHGEENVGGCPS